MEPITQLFIFLVGIVLILMVALAFAELYIEREITRTGSYKGKTRKMVLKKIGGE